MSSLDWVTTQSTANNTDLGAVASIGVRVPAGSTLMRLHFGFHLFVVRAAEEDPVTPEHFRSLIWGVRWLPTDTEPGAVGWPGNPSDQNWLLTGQQRPLNELVQWRISDDAPLTVMVHWGLDRTLESSESRRKTPAGEDRDLWFGGVLDLATSFAPAEPDGSTFWRVLIQSP